MNRIFASFTLLAALTLPAQADDALVAHGKALAEKNCTTCHSVGTMGDSPLRDAPPASSLTEALGEGLVTGHPDMPEFKFSPEDVGAIVSYLETLEGLQ